MAEEKSMVVALVISFIFYGLGLVYAGDVQKGIIIFVAAIACNLIAIFVYPFISLITIVIWVYGLYATYLQVKTVNGA